MRIALGAAQGRVVAMVVKEVSRMLVAGVVFGTLLAVGVTRLVSSVLYLARASGQYALIYGLVLVAGALGLTVNLVFRQVERWTLFWHPSIRGEVAA